MSRTRANALLALAALLLVALACNKSFTTAKISSIKLASDEKGAMETSKFEPADTVFAIVEIGGAIEKVKVDAKVVAADVEGLEANMDIPGAATSLELPGSGTATFKFSIPNRGWPKGKYRIEVDMKVASGEKKDSKSAGFTVE